MRVLDCVVHPETEKGLAEGGFVKEVTVSEKEDGNGRVEVVLKFRRSREPFAVSLVRQASEALEKAFPGTGVSVYIYSPEKEPAPVPSKRLPGVKHIIAVASGKGGVGKSTVAASLAVTLAAEGYRTGILDADIYGPSQPVLFGVDGYLPASDGKNADADIVPAESNGVKIMSIGFFISPADALVWRGPMATNALRQLLRQTAWGTLDYLLIDLPPGTGDVHLSVVQEIELDGAIIVSTPQSLAVADVRRGIEMFRSEGIEVPVLGIVENMAWFTPAELPENRYYIFGEGGARRLAEAEGIEFLGDIPIVPPAMVPEESGLQELSPELKTRYRAIVRRIVNKIV